MAKSEKWALVQRPSGAGHDLTEAATPLRCRAFVSCSSISGGRVVGRGWFCMEAISMQVGHLPAHLHLGLLIQVFMSRASIDCAILASLTPLAMGQILGGRLATYIAKTCWSCWCWCYGVVRMRSESTEDSLVGVAFLAGVLHRSE
jgi:hypothetical protein